MQLGCVCLKLRPQRYGARLFSHLNLGGKRGVFLLPIFSLVFRLFLDRRSTPLLIMAWLLSYLNLAWFSVSCIKKRSISLICTLPDFQPPVERKGLSHSPVLGLIFSLLRGEEEYFLLSDLLDLPRLLQAELLMYSDMYFIRRRGVWSKQSHLIR